MNPGTTAQLCAIFALDTDEWRKNVRKIFVPQSLRGDSKTESIKVAKENARIAYVKQVVTDLPQEQVVRVALFDFVKGEFNVTSSP